MSMNVSGKELCSQINVTPLVDVMLVLLIIFMVVTPMLQRGKSVRLPTVREPEKQTDDGKDLIVSVEFLGKQRQDNPDGSGARMIDRYNIYLGENLVNSDSLRNRLQDELRKEPDKEIYLKGDQRLNYSSVRRVMETCHQAGFQQVKLATEEIEKKKG